MRNNRISTYIQNKDVNTYLYAIIEMKDNINNDILNINHYYYQSWDTYSFRKKLRERDDGWENTHPNFTKQQFHKLYNHTFDNSLSVFYKQLVLTNK